MRRFKRIFASVLICALSISLFGSCGDSDEKEKSAQIESIFNEIEIEQESESVSESERESQTEASEHVYVLIPKESSSQLANRALDLVEMLREKTGLLVDLKYDNEYSSFPSGTCEVLIGHTNRLESENALAMLKTEDYVCRWDTGALVLCGGSEEATLEAIDLFISNILPKATKYSIMADNDGFEFVEGKFESSNSDVSGSDSEIGSGFEESATSSELESETVVGSESALESEAESKPEETRPKRSTFNGYVIDEFLIVYDVENGHGERNAAEILRALISARSGYLLDVVPSDAINSRTGKTISVLYDENASPYIESVEKNIVIKGSNLYNLALAVAEFVERMDKATQDGVITFNCEERIEVEKDSFDFSITTYFMKKSSEYNSLLELLDAIGRADRDVCVLLDISETVKQRMSLNMPNNYALYEIEALSKSFFVLYNSKTVSSLVSRVDDDKKSVELEIKFINGETIKYFYLLNSALPVTELERKSVYFFEGDGIDSEMFADAILSEGAAALDSSSLSYKIAVGNMLYEYDGGAKVNNTEFKLECSVSLATDIPARLLALTDSLK